MKRRSAIRRILVTLAVLGVVGSPAVSDAASFDFSTGSTTGTGFGNSITRTSAGITVTATGWSLTGNSGTTFQTSQLKIWSTGTGSCNQTEGLNCGTGPHTVDNIGQYDTVLFAFDQPVLLDTARITAWAADYDVSFWVGTGAISLLGQGLAILGTQYDDVFTGTATSGSSFRDVNLGAQVSMSVDWLVFGAFIPTDLDDRFKIKTLTVDPSTVPEPGTVLWLGTGALALAGWACGRRRRRL